MGGAHEVILPPPTSLVPRRLITKTPSTRAAKTRRTDTSATVPRKVDPSDPFVVTQPYAHGSSLCVDNLTVKTLKTLLIDVAEWLYPARVPKPSSQDYEELITGDAVKTLMNSKPPSWAILAAEQIPIPFLPDNMPSAFVEANVKFEDTHLQAQWESLYFLPVTKEMCEGDPVLAA
ncbi:hypothetical protein PHYPSEUDO_014457 [Phytophthora pseudosyringae]|uniref:Uncharacterized protein n=1 Tax=Phytophthora pseudosyringae TaxID=221518 RepID=A0A8T1V7M1_9STRA|nr:hypothetical protein PHYPSEUDO_014457 [Phytophthora pseudosyringae]